MIYLDASALVTLITERTYSTQLREYLDAEVATKSATSTIGFVETVRSCDRVGTFPNLMGQLQQDHQEILVDEAIRDDAAHLPGRLRSLDAIHVASAARLGSDLVAFVTYDQRMADAARNAGLPVQTPGLES